MNLKKGKTFQVFLSHNITPPSKRDAGVTLASQVDCSKLNWKGLQWHNIFTNCSENRLSSSKVETNTHTESVAIS